MPPYRINLALQGGGAHGAYTWGVLDRLLDEESLIIDSISGTSAGAMNAAVLVDGYHKGGRAGAKAALAHFWKEVSALGAFSPLQQTPLEQLGEGWNLDWSLSYSWMDLMSRLFSPYQLNPLNLNPLRWVLESCIDFKKLQKTDEMRLFITATAVHTGQPRVFKCSEVTADAVLASACIPFLFQAVEIGGEPYWDGGYMGNPALWPLIYKSRTQDILLVQINPLRRDETPKNAYDIINRLNEISFNSSLIAEMRAINFVDRLIGEHKLDSKHYKRMRMHMIEAHSDVQELNASSKLNATWPFFCFLREKGRQRAENWLRAHLPDVGKRSSVNIREMFLGGKKPVHPAVPLEQKPKPAPAKKTIGSKKKAKPRKKAA